MLCRQQTADLVFCNYSSYVSILLTTAEQTPAIIKFEYYQDTD